MNPSINQEPTDSLEKGNSRHVARIGTATLKIGVIGLGHWGPNHVRVFNESASANVIACTDLDQGRLRHIQTLYPELHLAASAEEIFHRSNIDAVVIATPASTHYKLAKAAIAAGKHVLLEKPMCASAKEAEELISLAKKASVVLMTGYVFVHNPGIQFIKKEIDRGQFGKVQYLHTSRTNLGPIRSDINVVMDLASHEFSIFDYFFGTLPVWISAAGSCLLDTPREDVAFLSMEYPGKILIHVNVSWLHPQKVRTLTLVGDKQMAVWDDLNQAEPVKIYNQGVAKEPFYDSFGEFQLWLRDLAVQVPKINLEEPLKLQAEEFMRRVQMNDSKDSELGLRVMKCLEAAEKSLRSDGKRIYLPR